VVEGIQDAIEVGEVLLFGPGRGIRGVVAADPEHGRRQ
jgi:hypothetical protein